MINHRAEQMWEYMLPPLGLLAGGLHASEQSPLDGLEIIDLGSGYGDFMELALKAGARMVHGVDKNVTNLELVDTRLMKAGILPYRYKLLQVDLNSKREKVLLYQRGWHVAFCFSILPYMDFPDDLLYMMAANTGLAFIECQYDQDGPGFSHIKNDDDMYRWLGRYWQSVRAIGKTDVQIRPAYRTIWMCGLPHEEKI